MPEHPLGLRAGARQQLPQLLLPFQQQGCRLRRQSITQAQGAEEVTALRMGAQRGEGFAAVNGCHAPRLGFPKLALEEEEVLAALLNLTEGLRWEGLPDRASRAASGPSGEARLRWALQPHSLQVRHPKGCSLLDKNQNIHCLSPAVAKDLDASSGTTEAEEHPNQTGFPEPWVPHCESAGRKLVEPAILRSGARQRFPSEEVPRVAASPGSVHLRCFQCRISEAAVTVRDDRKISP